VGGAPGGGAIGAICVEEEVEDIIVVIVLFVVSLM